jgi:hypothetical protein
MRQTDSRKIAVAGALITCVVSWVVAILAFASALSGSAVGLVLGLVLYGTPALTVVILGLLALKVLPGRSAADRQ